jgi:hypothetical protein
MTKIELNRSGGMLGKNLQAARQVDMDEEAIIKKLKDIAPVDNPYARDDFYHSITINENQTFPIDMGLLKGKLKKIITELEGNLKVKEK